MYTAASATHIKAVVKDDTLGLGAGSKRLDEPTGLGAFQGLLGRLNGKSDAELEKEERTRDDAKLARYAATKWQAVRFISGGLLTQEKNETPEPSHKNTRSDSDIDKESAVKKRKKKDDNHESSTSDTQATSKSTKKRKSKKSHREGSEEETTKSKERKEKKKSKKRKNNKEESPHSSPDGDGSQVKRSKEKPLPAPTAAKEHRPMGRHIFRGRHMEAKKKAMLDDKSLSEVFSVISWCFPN